MKSIILGLCVALAAPASAISPPKAGRWQTIPLNGTPGAALILDTITGDAYRILPCPGFITAKNTKDITPESLQNIISLNSYCRIKIRDINQEMVKP